MVRILLADDDADLRFINEIALSDAGFEVVTAINGRDAVKKAKQDRFDLILLDAMMPEMDGYEAFRALQADTDTSSIPVVFLTAQAPDRGMLQSLGIGLLNYILKPCDPDELTQRIRSVLDQTGDGDGNDLHNEKP